MVQFSEISKKGGSMQCLSTCFRFGTTNSIFWGRQSTCYVSGSHLPFIPQNHSLSFQNPYGVPYICIIERSRSQALQSTADHPSILPFITLGCPCSHLLSLCLCFLIHTKGTLMASTSRTIVRVNETTEKKRLLLWLHTKHIINSTEKG